MKKMLKVMDASGDTRIESSYCTLQTQRGSLDG